MLGSILEVLCLISKMEYLNTDNYEKALVTLWDYNRLNKDKRQIHARCLF
jgi:hypothetical protein